jgi:hypothetical protein
MVPRSSFPKQPPGHLCGCIYEGQLSGGQERNVACSNVPRADIRTYPHYYANSGNQRDYLKTVRHGKVLFNNLE